MRAWPREEAFEEELARQLARGEACGLSGQEVTWDKLFDRVAQEAGVRPLDREVGRLALRRACREATAGTRLVRVGGTSGFLDAAARFIGACERAGMDAAEAGAAAGQVPGAMGERLRILAAAYQLYAATLGGEVGSLDRRHGVAVARLREGAGRFDEIVIKPRLAWDAADVQAVLALAGRSRSVVVELPYGSGRPGVYDGIEPVLRAFEARPDLLALDIRCHELEPGAPLSVLAAPTAEAELRAVAARARELVDGGAPPEEVVIAARAPAGIAAPLAAEMARVGLALEHRYGDPLAATAPARLAIGILTLVERGFPREEALALAGSSHTIDGVAARRTRRDAGAAERRTVRDHTAGRAEKAARLARKLGVRELDPRSAGGGLDRIARAEDGDEAVKWLRPLLDAAAALPEQGTPAEHARALANTLAALGVREELPQHDPGLIGDPLERAFARDRRAASALIDLLEWLPAAAAAAGWGDAGADRVSRAGFAAILADLMENVPVRAIGARGGAVRLLHLRDLAARRFAHLIVPRLVEGEAPLHASDDGVFGEREQRALDRALGRWVFARGERGEDERSPAASYATPFEELMLEHALATAGESVTLTYPTTVAGRAVARSPFVDEVVRAGRGAAVILPLSPVAPVERAASTGDLLASVVLDLHAAPGGRLPGSGGDPAVVAAARAALAGACGERLARVEALAAIEAARWTFFGGGPACPHVGSVPVIGGPPLAAGGGGSLAARIGGTAAFPISAGDLEKYANCPFTFFANRVLRVRPEEEGEDNPPPLHVGRIAHECLELFYDGRIRAGALPLRGDSDDLDALNEACDEAFARAEKKETPGNAALWSLTMKRLREDLWRWIAREAAAMSGPGGGLPAYVELPFGLPGEPTDGRPKLPALVLGEGDGAVHVAGRIDRVDLLPNGRGVVVVDYKLGRAQNHAAKLKVDAVADTALQLPLYAAAAARGLATIGVTLADDATLDGVFIGLRDGQATKTLRKALGEEAGEMIARVEQRAVELGAGMRAGTFHVAPRECGGCNYRSVCRVVALKEEETDEEGAPR